LRPIHVFSVWRWKESEVELLDLRDHFVGICFKVHRGSGYNNIDMGYNVTVSNRKCAIVSDYNSRPSFRLRLVLPTRQSKIVFDTKNQNLKRG
jgi:hypothetical protein